MRVDVQADGTPIFYLGYHVPALAIVLEAEAPPRIFGDLDREKIDRIMLGLTEEWRDLLLAAIESTRKAT